MGKLSKSRGTSYEYRIRDWFKSLNNWDAERNPLSGASDQISQEIGLHDVRAWTLDFSIFLQIEAKKTAKKSKHILKKEWLDGLNFDNDELLIFAMSRTSHYALITSSRYREMYGRGAKSIIKKNKPFAKDVRGKKSFTVHQEWFSIERPTEINWKSAKKKYIVIFLEEYIKLRIEYAKREVNAFNFDNFVRCCDDISKLLEHKETNKLTYYQLSSIYSRCAELEQLTSKVEKGK